MTEAEKDDPYCYSTVLDEENGIQVDSEAVRPICIRKTCFAI
jgi:hypothetical protein